MYPIDLQAYVKLLRDCLADKLELYGKRGEREKLRFVRFVRDRGCGNGLSGHRLSDGIVCP